MRAPLPRSLPSAWRRILGTVLLGSLLGLWSAPLVADEPVPTDRLGRARYMEHVEAQHEQALEAYLDLATEDGLDPALRGEALLGAARCHRALGNVGEAERIWARILADATLPVSVLDRARRDQEGLRAERTRVDEDVLQEEAHRRLEAERRERARELVEEGRRALTEGRFEEARERCLAALQLDPESPQVNELLGLIGRSLPDRGRLLQDILSFAQTTRIQTFHRLKAQIEALEQEGRDHYQAGNYAWADERFRRAIDVIDRSEFLGHLADERLYLLRWLRRTIEEGRAQGLAMEPEPDLPEASAVTGGVQRRLFDVLSDLFAAWPEQVEPLRLYEVKGPSGPPRPLQRNLLPGRFAEGIAIAVGESDLGRARWAERWIRANLGASWTPPEGLGSGATHLLERFGDLLIVQHGEAVHRQVRQLLERFSDPPGPVVLDVAVLASTNAGGTRIAARLGARASPRESGLDLEVRGRLIEECTEDVKNLEGVVLLGTARLSLSGLSSASLEITRRTDEHPTVAGLPNPRVDLRVEEARYGLWVEMYAEDLPRGGTVPSAALSVRASTSHPQATVVVPKPTLEADWSRLPKPMAEQVMTSDRVVAHVGTLLLLGLANPFPESAATHPDLVLLVGVRPGSREAGTVPVPDPPRTGPGEGPGGQAQEREYLLGPLATEVLDEVVSENWPQRPASRAVPSSVARRAREEYLAERLGVAWASLVPPGEASPVSVNGGLATARLSPSLHDRLRRAVQRLRAEAATLYEVVVVAVEVDEQQLAEWLRLSGAHAFTPGTYLLTNPASLQALEQRMRPQGTTPSVYTSSARLLARSTQKVAMRTLRTQTIVEDMRQAYGPDGSRRFIPQTGTAEEGLVVLVRPELEENGRRLVVVDARAARLRSLESLALGEPGQPAVRVQVPRHHPIQVRQAAAPLGDREALFLTLPAPEGTGRVVAVKVTVRRIL